MDKKMDLLVRVSELYYEQDLNQSAIADILGTSRPTVSAFWMKPRKAAW